MKKYSATLAGLVILIIVSYVVGEGSEKQGVLNKDSIQQIAVEIKGETYSLGGKVVCTHEKNCTAPEEERSLTQLKHEFDIKKFTLERGTELKLSFSSRDPDIISYDEIKPGSVRTKSVKGMSFEVYGLDGVEKFYRIGVQWKHGDGKTTRAYYPIAVKII